MKSIYITTAIAALFALSACDEGKKGEDAKTDAPAADTASDKAAAEKDEEEPAETPACDKVVDQIASFNPGSGDAERKLWNKMCDEMTPKQRTCVAASKDMGGMKSCMGSKGDEKLE
jgi:hypothetical protein